MADPAAAAAAPSTASTLHASPRQHSPRHPPGPELLSVADHASDYPANIARPRRLSMSDPTLLQRALSRALSHERPTAAIAAAGARMHTRFSVSTDEVKGSATHTEVFSLAYSPDSTILSAGCGDGSIRLFDASAGAGHKLARVLRIHQDVEHLPTTCVRFNPAVGSRGEDGSSILLAAQADGTVSQWRVGGKSHADPLPLRTTISPNKDSVYALAYAPAGTSFATAGRDHTVRIYDEVTGALAKTCENAGAHGHSNRIYALRWHPTDPHVLLSGGWDNTIQFWDTRTGYSSRSIFGPHLCGDALDIQPVTGAEILTGSWTEAPTALQRWDFGTGKLLEDIPWNGKAAVNAAAAAAAAASEASSSSSSSASSSPSENCMLYSASYSPDATLIAAGGAGNGVNQAKLFSTVTGAPIERVSFQHALYSLAFAPNAALLAFGGVDTDITVVKL